MFLRNFISVPEIVPTRSNVTYKELNNILQTFNLDLVDKKWEGGLSKLLCFRNRIAHGENSITVEDADVEFFSQMLNGLMVEVCSLIVNGMNEKRYQRA